MGILLYPELECKMSGTPVLTERLVTEGRWFRVVRTRIGIHGSNFNSWCDEYGDLLQPVEQNTIKTADVVCSGDIWCCTLIDKFVVPLVGETSVEQRV